MEFEWMKFILGFVGFIVGFAIVQLVFIIRR